MFAGLGGEPWRQKDRAVRLLRLGQRRMDGTVAARCKEDGAVLYDESGLIVNEAPDDEALGRCRDLGRALAAW